MKCIQLEKYSKLFDFKVLFHWEDLSLLVNKPRGVDARPLKNSGVTTLCSKPWWLRWSCQPWFGCIVGTIIVGNCPFIWSLLINIRWTCDADTDRLGIWWIWTVVGECGRLGLELVTRQCGSGLRRTAVYSPSSLPLTYASCSTDFVFWVLCQVSIWEDWNVTD